jgi:hypothetical protein
MQDKSILNKIPVIRFKLKNAMIVALGKDLKRIYSVAH